MWAYNVQDAVKLTKYALRENLLEEGQREVIIKEITRRSLLGYTHALMNTNDLSFWQTHILYLKSVGYAVAVEQHVNVGHFLRISWAYAMELK